MRSPWHSMRPASDTPDTADSSTARQLLDAHGRPCC
nr:MAG TPA: hypothetical protein [Inoviridae sp.]